MNNVIFLSELHIILEEINNTDFLNTIDTVISIIVGIISIIGGLLGIFLLKNLREKSLNATLGYFSRLKVHIHSLNSTFESYYTEIFYRFLPENSRPEEDQTKISFINDIINNFSDEAIDTLLFLKNEDNQMPADSNWMNEFNILLEFLEDMKYIKQPRYYKFSTDEHFNENSVKDYYKKHSNNLSNILKSIEKHQEKIQDQLYKNKR